MPRCRLAVPSEVVMAGRNEQAMNNNTIATFVISAGILHVLQLRR